MLVVYPSVLNNVIFAIVVSITIMSNCLKGNKKGTGKKKPSKLTTPIAYETDPALLERERKLRILENKEKMRKKREKNTNKTLEESKTVPANNYKEQELLPEDVTQPTTDSDDSTEVNIPAAQREKDSKGEKSNDKMNKTQPLEEPSNNKPSNDTKLSSDEELGDIQLVNNDPDAVTKNNVIKQQATEQARKKQLTDALTKSLQRPDQSTKIRDDTLRNISSIKIETQLSTTQQNQPGDDAVKTIGDTTESQMVIEATIVEPKSNPMYLRELTHHVMRGSAEPSGTGS